MATPPPILQVAATDGVALIKITGRASFNCSVDFKALMYGLHKRGLRRFVLDLGDCLIMDSTFLGVLAGFALKIGELRADPAAVTLLNPSQRLLDLLENLGVAQLFAVVHGTPPSSEGYQQVCAPGTGPSKLETSRTCLEAHETLMAICPANIPKFKDVTRFMAEDLKRQEGDSH